MRRSGATVASIAADFAINLAILVVAIAAIWAAIHAWMAFAYPSYFHRFRLTVEIDTPTGLRTESSTFEVERKDNRWIPVPGSRFRRRIQGEALFVDLGDGRNVVATLAHGDNAENVDDIRSFWVEAFGYLWYDEDVWEGRKRLQGVVELKPALIPTIVTFADPLDPNTVRVVRPSEFEQVFGPGFRFHRATVEVVPESVPVTDGIIEQHLPWLATVTTNLAGTRGISTNDIRERLGRSSFKRREK